MKKNFSPMKHNETSQCYGILMALLVSGNAILAQNNYHDKVDSALTSQIPFHKNIIYVHPLSPVTGHIDAGYERYFNPRNAGGLTLRYFFKALDFQTQNPEPKGYDGAIYYKWILSKRAPEGWFVRASITAGEYLVNAEYEDCSQQIYGDGRWHCASKYGEQKFFSAGPGIAFGHQWVTNHGFIELALGFKYLPVPDKVKSYDEHYSLKHLWGNIDWVVPVVSPGAVTDLNFSLGFRF